MEETNIQINIEEVVKELQQRIGGITAEYEGQLATMQVLVRKLLAEKEELQKQIEQHTEQSKEQKEVK